MGYRGRRYAVGGCFFWNVWLLLEANDGRRFKGSDDHIRIKVCAELRLGKRC